MIRKFIFFTILASSLSLNAQGWGGGWGSGGGDDDSGSEDVSLGSSSTQEAKPAPPKITVEAIGTHYDDEPAAHYEPEYVNQDTNISLLHGDQLVIQRPYLRQADVKFRRRIWRVIDLRQKLNKAWTWPRSPISQVFWELGTKGLVRAYANDSFNRIITPETIIEETSSLDEVPVLMSGIDPETATADDYMD